MGPTGHAGFNGIVGYPLANNQLNQTIDLVVVLAGAEAGFPFESEQNHLSLTTKWSGQPHMISYTFQTIDYFFQLLVHHLDQPVLVRSFWDFVFWKKSVDFSFDLPH